MSWNRLYQSIDGEGGKSALKEIFMPASMHERPCPFPWYRAGQGKLEWIGWLSLYGATIVLHVEQASAYSVAWSR